MASLYDIGAVAGSTVNVTRWSGTEKTTRSIMATYTAAVDANGFWSAHGLPLNSDGSYYEVSVPRSTSGAPTVYDVQIGAAGGYDLSTLTAVTLTNALVTTTRNVNTVAASGTTQTIPDVLTATVNRITLTGNCTFTFPTAAAGKGFDVVLVQDGTGSRLATWPAAAKWTAATAPTLTITAAKSDWLRFLCVDGTNWLGSTVALNL